MGQNVIPVKWADLQRFQTLNLRSMRCTILCDIVCVCVCVAYVVLFLPAISVLSKLGDAPTIGPRKYRMPSCRPAGAITARSQNFPALHCSWPASLGETSCKLEGSPLPSSLETWTPPLTSSSEGCWVPQRDSGQTPYRTLSLRGRPEASLPPGSGWKRHQTSSFWGCWARWHPPGFGWSNCQRSRFWGCWAIPCSPSSGWNETQRSGAAAWPATVANCGQRNGQSSRFQGEADSPHPSYDWSLLQTSRSSASWGTGLPASPGQKRRQTSSSRGCLAIWRAAAVAERVHQRRGTGGMEATGPGAHGINSKNMCQYVPKSCAISWVECCFLSFSCFMLFRGCYCQRDVPPEALNVLVLVGHLRWPMTSMKLTIPQHTWKARQWQLQATPSRLWLNSSPKLKHRKLSGSVAPSKLRLKRPPKVKLCKRGKVTRCHSLMSCRRVSSCSVGHWTKARCSGSSSLPSCNLRLGGTRWIKVVL